MNANKLFFKRKFNFEKANFKKHLFSLIIISFLFVVQFSLVANVGEVKATWWSHQIGMGGDEVGGVFGESSGDPRDVRDIVIDIIKVILTFFALIFTILLVWAGYKWMMSRGNENEVTEAKSQVKAAVIGIIVVMFSYAITYFVTETFRKEVTGDIW